MKNDEMNKMQMRRMAVLMLLLLVWLGGIAFCAYKIIVVEGDFWRALAERNRHTSRVVSAKRGNIYSYDHQLLASSLSTYRLFLDFEAEGFDGAVFDKSVDSLCLGLNKICPNAVTPQLSQKLKQERIKPRGRRNRRFPLTTTYLSYTQYTAARALPYLRGGKRKGFYCDTRIERKKPFGSLAARAIGEIYGEMEKGGSCGLEKTYNVELAGKPGLAVTEDRARTRLSVNLDDPTDGLDLVTTLDVDMQDIAESELRTAMNNGGATQGCAVVMDVKTGEIRAISNLTRNSEGALVETLNHAIMSQTEPGSTFKLASVIALLDAGKADTSLMIDTDEGEWKESNWKKPMRDHNHSQGGYGKISLAQAVWYSSNIGISKPVYEAYRSCSEKFVERLYAMKLNEKVDLEFAGAGHPVIKHPKDESARWSGTSLPWMSIGYEVEIPPIYTLMFYNAIANNGKMIKPIFSRGIEKNGSKKKSFNTEVICEKICSGTTLSKVHDMLRGVVEYGTGKPAKSNIINIAGKSGTSQQKYGKSGPAGYQFTFCGYFPAEAPRYSCIVVLWQSSYTSNYSTKAFGRIAERIYALEPVKLPKEIGGLAQNLYPPTKNGQRDELKEVFSELNLVSNINQTKSQWVRTAAGGTSIDTHEVEIKKAVVPNVIGMGAKDAIYLLENAGLKVDLIGRGEVAQQSVPPGSTASKGSRVRIVMK